MAKPKKALSKKPAAVAQRKARRAAKKAAPAAAKKTRKAAKKAAPANPGTTLVSAAPFGGEKFRCYGKRVKLRKGVGPRGFCKRNK